MIFASPLFLFWFLPAALLCYYGLPGRFRSGVLVIASYLFYGWWRPDFCLLMVASTLVDYCCGGAIGRIDSALDAGQALDVANQAARRKRYLVLSVVFNLGLLAYFKYANFGIDSLNILFRSVGLHPVAFAKVVLPIGISFYTFQTMSYTIDVYLKECTPVRSLVDFACYVALFPQLIAGPIVRYRTIARQLVDRTHTMEKMVLGGVLFQMGFAKKLLLADTVAGIADAAFKIAAPTTAEAWLGTLAYALQIYFDFSGYSDMAIGLGLMFGFRFPRNFHSPYQSKSITEFWRRWHISLSSWLRDYLYIPLGGNRKGNRRTYQNLAITMLLGGLWHGASWTFVAWGGYQGFWLCIERLAGKRPFYSRWPRALRVLLTFVLVLFGWVFFRATSFTQAFAFISAMLGISTPGLTVRFLVERAPLFALATGAAVAFLGSDSFSLVERRSLPAFALSAVLFPIAVAQMLYGSYSPFLYFRF